MKPAKNSIIGYSYQKLVAFYILALMDVEREILEMEIEADVDHKFDDLIILNKDGTKIYCQMKDYEKINISDITVKDGVAKIKSETHKKAINTNIIFFKHIDINPNSEILGLPSYLIDDVHIISLSREEIMKKIDKLYEIDLPRISIITTFFERRFDERNLLIKLQELPVLKTFSHELMDPTIRVMEFNADDQGPLLFIEGKPGVGKSHLVNNIKVNGEKIIYRFWISNQDYDYQKRLKYDNFIGDLIKRIFNKLVKKDLDEIISELKNNKITLIIDGLDHVENYNPCELEKYVQFINKAKDGGAKVIILSRPLKYKHDWKIYRLQNWNFKQTCFFLENQYHLSDYMLFEDIFHITQGYPILVKFIAESYKINNELPDLPQLEAINEYYDIITEKYSNKETLAIFLSSNSYFMMSEFDTLLGYSSMFIKQIINDHPYLFEIKLNRISLLHDSLNTYLRSTLSENEYVKQLILDIKNKVYHSIMTGEKRFVSRYLSFDFNEYQQLEIIKKYADINFFEEWIEGTIDIEAIQEFYNQMRVSLENIPPEQLTIYNYYDFILISNILLRDHISTLKDFLYIYVSSLLFNGYTEDDITSSGYVFGMLYFIKEGNYTSLEMVEANNHYDTTDYYINLQKEIEKEKRYFEVLETSIDFKKLQMLLQEVNNELDFKNLIENIFVALYIHDVPTTSELAIWKKEIHNFIDNQEDITSFVKTIFKTYGYRDLFAKSVIYSVKYKLKTLGVLQKDNEFLNLSLKEFINYYKNENSYHLIECIKDYLRLNLYLEKQIDLSSIYKLFTSYYARKDYTVSNIWKPLILFQRKGYLKIEKSVEIIKEFQSKSEKGIRHILNIYVDNLNNEEFSYFIQEIYPKDEDLNLDIFQLSPEKINILDFRVVQIEFFEMLRTHNYSKTFEYHDLKNLLYSKYSNEVCKILDEYQYKILVQSGSFNIEDFKGFEKIFLITNEANFSEANNITSNYEKGYLNIQDIPFIIKEKLSPIEIASLPDGNYCAFSELDLYKHFDKEVLTANLTAILKAAICSKIYSIDSPSYLFEMVGNVPVFLDEFVDINVEFANIFSSFLKFIKLSGVS